MDNLPTLLRFESMLTKQLAKFISHLENKQYACVNIITDSYGFDLKRFAKKKSNIYYYFNSYLGNKYGS
jgi:hypothetical protein